VILLQVYQFSGFISNQAVLAAPVFLGRAAAELIAGLNICDNVEHTVYPAMVMLPCKVQIFFLFFLNLYFISVQSLTYTY